MTGDVRTLLHDTAEAPSREPDIERALRSARTHRRRQRGFGGLVAVVVIALVVGMVTVGGGGGDDPPVAVGLRQTGAQIPEGWGTVHADPGTSLSIPPEWNTYAFGSTDVAATRFSVGTVAPPGPPTVVTACFDTGSIPTQAGTWLTVWEYPDATATEIVAPIDGTMTVSGDRPATFTTSQFQVGSCDHAGNLPDREVGASFEQIAFRDAGRLFVARVVTTHPVGETAEFGMANRVLDTLRVEPLESATTTSPTAPPTVVGSPQQTVTTLPAFVPTTDDERAIVQVFTRWADSATDADLDAIAEDPDAVRAPSHAGWDQHPTDLALYDSRVESIRTIDSDHAQLVYTILYRGQVAYGNRLGSAVRVDGEWKVSTETVCGMLTIGGIRCPA